MSDENLKGLPDARPSLFQKSKAKSTLGIIGTTIMVRIPWPKKRKEGRRQRRRLTKYRYGIMLRYEGSPFGGWAEGGNYVAGGRPNRIHPKETTSFVVLSSSIRKPVQKTLGQEKKENPGEKPNGKVKPPQH